MNNLSTTIAARALWSTVAALLMLCTFAAQTLAQTAGGVVISNTATATYSDGTQTYNATSNTVTVTVANVAGLTITPDETSSSASVPAGVSSNYTFTVTNTSNFSNVVQFGTTGVAYQLSGAGSSGATVTQAFVDADNSGTFNTGDVDITTAGAQSASLAMNASVTVIIRVTSASNASGDLTVTLGDASTGGASFDNQAHSATGNDVFTVTAGINGQREAKGTKIKSIATVSLLNGPSGAPAATGPGGNTNTDFTNKSIQTGINVAYNGGAGTTSSASEQVVFTNTLRNDGGLTDTVTLSVPAGGFPAGATVDIDSDGAGGGGYVTVINAGAATGNPVPTVSLAAGATANYTVRVTLPSGLVVTTGYDTVIRATSGLNNTFSNETIDRLYTGFMRLVKAATVSGGSPAATDPVPGATLTYAITYENVSSSGSVAGASGNITLTVSNLTITEDGAAGGNNWATTTTHVSATDAGGTVTPGVGNNSYTDLIASLAPGATGTFTIVRTIN
ncbi:MAG TPA: hypothetical protein VM870_06425 [Pyrinomonadaceae bacterium]|jgi:hypothetical protein|nr:hypothetical protein [Pyrinomonadaceae bacterium]